MYTVDNMSSSIVSSNLKILSISLMIVEFETSGFQIPIQTNSIKYPVYSSLVDSLAKERYAKTVPPLFIAFFIRMGSYGHHTKYQDKEI